MIKDWEVLGGYLDQFSHCRRRTEARESKDFAKAMCCQGSAWPGIMALCPTLHLHGGRIWGGTRFACGHWSGLNYQELLRPLSKKTFFGSLITINFLSLYPDRI